MRTLGLSNCSYQPLCLVHLRSFVSAHSFLEHSLHEVPQTPYLLVSQGGNSKQKTTERPPDKGKTNDLHQETNLKYPNSRCLDPIAKTHTRTAICLLLKSASLKNVIQTKHKTRASKQLLWIWSRTLKRIGASALTKAVKTQTLHEIMEIFLRYENKNRITKKETPNWNKTGGVKLGSKSLIGEPSTKCKTWKTEKPHRWALPLSVQCGKQNLGSRKGRRKE